jgi:hypothetical protein
MDSGRTRIPIMSHLSSERLAELADGEPTVAEAEHLAACATCATERSAHRRLLTLAVDERARLAAPLTTWATLSARLRDEGIIATPMVSGATHGVAGAHGNVVPFAPPPRRHRRAWLAGLRVAAGIVIAATFGALGRISAGADAKPSVGELQRVAQHLIPGDESRLLPPILPGPTIESVEEALATLADAQRDYDRAVAYIAVHDSTVQSPDADHVYRARLAALDEMAETSLQALSVAPADPVLNQYYLSTLGAREVTLRQLGSVLTPGKRLSRF